MPSPSRGTASRWDDRPLATKVLAAVGVAALVAVVIGLVGLRALNSAADTSSSLAGDNIPDIVTLNKASQSLADIRIQIRNTLIAVDDAGSSKAQDQIAVAQDDFDAELADFAATPMTPEQSDLVDQITATMTEYRSFISGTLQPLADANDNAAWYTATTSSSLGSQINDLMTQLADTEAGVAAEQAAAGQASYEAQRTGVIVALVIGLALAMTTGVVVARRLTRQVSQVQAVAEALAAGDLTVASGLTSRDEVGRMATALDASIVDLRAVMSSVVASSDAVASASEELSASSAEISAAAEETSAQSGVVSAAAEEVSRSVATVAAGAEQMGASIREIAQNANEAARVASQAVGVAATANETVTKLGTSSKEIGDVVKTITSIAEQTNLLALNATIEAARAGEAGKGFAVVANEVKELAQETARATEDISRRVATIQADTTGAVAAIDEISSIIASINDFQTTIASAVEEQTATTNEMSRSVAEAAGGSTEIAANITGVSTAASSTTQALSQTRIAVSELASLAAQLRGQVTRFTA